LLMLELAESPESNADIAVKSAHAYIKSGYPSSNAYMAQFRQNILYILYKVGIVGIKV